MYREEPVMCQASHSQEPSCLHSKPYIDPRKSLKIPDNLIEDNTKKIIMFLKLLHMFNLIQEVHCIIYMSLFMIFFLLQANHLE